MSDVTNKRVHIYIDQSSAEMALEKLQSKADGFNKKIEDCRQKQTQLLEKIKQSEAAAANIDTLKASYNNVGKEIDATRKKLQQNDEQTRIVKRNIEELSRTYELSAAKQRQLQDQIAQAKGDGKSTASLERQLNAVNRELDRTGQKIGQEAQEIFRLDQVTGQLNAELDVSKQRHAALRGEMKLAGNAASNIKQAQQEYKKLDKTIDDATESLRQNAAAQRPVQEQINSKLRPSIEQLRNQVSKLRNELIRMSEDTPGYADKFSSFRKASANLQELETRMNGTAKAQRSWMADAKTVAFGVLIGNTVQQATMAIGSYLSGMVSGNAKLSDSLADIEKATGLSGAAVAQLNKDLGKIDTRTATSDLREIAVGLGQIGQEANKANVAAIDQIVVALGDEFGGGAREITTVLSVLRNNLQDMKSGNYAEDVSRIGNALNTLGAEGLATAPVVTNIANRIAGVGQTFGITSGQILGVAATFQELGIAEERGSTAIIKLFQKIGAEPEKFSKMTKLSVQDFKNLVNTDMLSAFQLVAEGAREAGSTNVEFSKILKDLDADGSGAGEVLSKLGANSELLAAKVNLATQALTSTDSIVEEFGKKNNNLAAELEKLNKQFNSLIQSKTLADFFAVLVRAAGNLISMFKALPAFVNNNKTALALLAIGIATLNAHYIKSAVLIIRDTALRVINAATTRATALATNLAIASQSAYITVTTLLTGRITLATAAQRLWNIALSLGAGPIGVIVLAAGALVFALDKLVFSTRKLSAEQRVSSELNAKAGEDVASQKASIDTLTNAVNNNALSLDDRKKALQALININPAYLGGLTLENVKTAEGKKIIDDYIVSLDRMARAKATQSYKEDLFKKQFEARTKAEQVSQETSTPSTTIGIGFQAGMQAVGLGGYTDMGKRIEAGQNVAKAGADIAAFNNLIKRDVDDVNKLIDVQTKKIAGLAEGTADHKNEQAKLNDLVAIRNTFLGLEAEATTNTKNELSKTLATSTELTKEQKAAVDRRGDLLKQLQDFHFELQQVGKKADESEIDRITRKYNDLMQQATRYGVSVIDIEKAKNKAIAFLLDEEKRKRDEVVRANNKKADEALYKSFQQDAAAGGETEKEKAQQQYADGIINKRQLEEAIRRIDLETLEFQITLAKGNKNLSEEAAKDEVELTRRKNKIIRDDAVKTREFTESQKQKDDLAGAQLKILTTRPDSKKRLDANVDLLRIEREQALQAEDLTQNELARIKEEYRQKEAQLIIDFYAAQIEQTLGFISQGLDVISKFNDAKSAREKAQLDRELKQNDARKRSIERLEQQRVISSQEARRRLRAIELDEERKKEALEKKQFERAKRIQIAQAIVNGAMAITSTLAARPGATDIISLGAFRAIQIAIAVATTAAQIATISAQKFAGGGRAKRLTNGLIDSSERNIPIQPNGDDVLATVKAGEVLLNKEQQRKLGGDETFRKIGVPGFAGGGRVSMRSFWQATPYRGINYPLVERSMRVVRFADGGRVARTEPVAEQAPPQQPVVIAPQDNEMKTLMRAMLHRLDNPVAPNMSLKKLDDAYLLRDRMEKESRMR